MKAMVIDDQIKVYSSTDANSVSIASLPKGSEINYVGTKKSAGKMWIQIALSTGQPAFISGDTRIHIIREGSIMQNNVELHAQPSSESLVKSQLALKTKVFILEVVKGDGVDWVRVRDGSGSEGYIQGTTRIRLEQQRTKASGRRSMVSGAMWLAAGLVIVFSQSAQTPGGGYIYLGYGALAFGAIMFISGIYQYVTAQS